VASGDRPGAWDRGRQRPGAWQRAMKPRARASGRADMGQRLAVGRSRQRRADSVEPGDSASGSDKHGADSVGGCEGSEKATRERGEWESIKIPQNNLAYITNQTQRPSLLTRPSPYSYNKTIGLRNRVRHRSGSTSRCWQVPVRD
jgi:hypothetical protein